MPWGSIWRRTGATRVKKHNARGVILGLLAAGLGCGEWSGLASGQESMPRGGREDGVVAEGVAGGAPSLDVGLRAFELVESWVRAGAVAEGAAVPSSIRSVGGACVMIRLDGSIVGRGAEVGEVGGECSVVRAARAAIEEAMLRLPVANDALAAEHRREWLPMLAVSVELAGDRVPMDPGTYESLDADLSPGLDGVEATLEGKDGETKRAATFPSEMLISGASPSWGLQAAISRASGDATMGVGQPGEIAHRTGFRFWKFRTIHLVQARGGARPLVLYRGSEVISKSRINGALLREFAAGLGAHIERRCRGGGLGGGSIVRMEWPTTRRAEESAEVVPRALAAVALARMSRVSSLSVESRDSAREMARRMTTTLYADFGNGESIKRVDAAMLTLAFEETMLAEGAGDEWMGKPAAAVVSRVGAALAGTFSAEHGWGEGMPGSARGLAAYALVLRGVREGTSRASLRAMVSSVLRESLEGKSLVTHMPWIVWAEIALSEDGAIASAEALRNERVLVESRQVPDVVAGVDPDFAGGFMFDGGVVGSRPTWNSMRGVAFLAAMLGDRRLTDEEERLPELSRLLSALRFARQLAADEASGALFVDVERARWGIRAATWDPRQSIEASAMGLIGVCESVRVLDEWSAHPEAPARGGGDGANGAERP